MIKKYLSKNILRKISYIIFIETKIGKGSVCGSENGVLTVAIESCKGRLLRSI
jgi:hypothetical protein